MTEHPYGGAAMSRLVRKEDPEKSPMQSGEVTPAGAKPTTAAPRVLLFGYNGANNTGAEALLLADIEDVRAVLGPDAVITVPTLNEANLRRYLKEGSGLRIAHIPAVYFRA